MDLEKEMKEARLRELRRISLEGLAAIHRTKAPPHGREKNREEMIHEILEAEFPGRQ